MIFLQYENEKNDSLYYFVCGYIGHSDSHLMFELRESRPGQSQVASSDLTGMHVAPKTIVRKVSWKPRIWNKTELKDSVGLRPKRGRVHSLEFCKETQKVRQRLGAKVFLDTTGTIQGV